MSTKDNFPYHNAGLSIGQLNENLKACRWKAQKPALSSRSTTARPARPCGFPTPPASGPRRTARPARRLTLTAAPPAPTAARCDSGWETQPQTQERIRKTRWICCRLSASFCQATEPGRFRDVAADGIRCDRRRAPRAYGVACVSSAMRLFNDAASQVSLATVLKSPTADAFNVASRTARSCFFRPSSSF